jgi:regulatory protein
MTSKDPYDIAVRLLAQRQHSQAELRQKLARRGCEPAEVDTALRRLAELGYLDDGAYASALVARRARSRGPAAIAAELAARGVARATAAAAVAELDRDEMLRAARRLVAASAGVDPTRLAGRLQRRGFPADVVRAVLHDRDPAD